MTHIDSRFNWTLRRQLGVVVVIGVGALAAVSGVALLGVQAQTQRLHQVGSEILPIQRLAAELDSNLLREDVEYQRMLRAGYAIAAGESLGADWLVKGREGFKKAKEASAHDQQTLTALLQSSQQGAGSEAREALGSLAQLTQAVVGAQSLYEARVQEVVQLIERGDLDTASAGISGVSEQRAKVHALLAEVSKSVQELTEATVVTSAHDAQRIRWQLAAVLLGSAVVMLGLSVWMMRRLSRQAVQTKEAIEKVASGDLISPVPEGGHDELGEILQAVGLMQGRLSTLVSEVREGANSVATASVEIAQGNQDLSHRTEQQAAALEQTASSMEQLGATVQHNASNAQQADHLAQTASEVAIKGGAVVSEVVSTMRSINDSSRKISDIISVIDGIAFQTNILSLNAAVEAARAGEQGRGFAVVATEVRSLAQRSAQAAREIKSLISSNVERVEQGSVLVDKAGATMDEVVASIRQVTEIVNQISQASREQNEGVSQVGVAVSQMDTQTQQNAALVEQSAAAADALREQAQHLLHAVSAFRTS